MNGFYISQNRFYIPDYERVASIGLSYEDEVGRSSEYLNYIISGLSRHQPFFSAVSIAYKNGVVGTGFNIQSKTEHRAFNKRFESLIRKWGQKKSRKKERSNCEISGRYYFQKAQRVLVDEYAVKSGGFIIAHHFGKNFKYGYKFEIIPLHMIDTSVHNVADNKFNGIEINGNGEITHINIYENSLKQRSNRISYDKLTLAINIMYDPTQYSGASPLAPIVEALEFIDSYKNEEMTGAKKRARTPIFIHTPYYSEWADAQAKAIADEQRENGIKPNINEIKTNLFINLFGQRRLDRKEDFNKDYAYLDIEEKVSEMGKGVESIYREAWDNESKLSSAGVGLSVSSTFGTALGSYNEALRAVQSEEQIFKVVAQDIVEDCLREMIEDRLLIGLIDKGYFDDLIDKKKFYTDEEYQESFKNCVFMRVEKGHIDPVKTAKAYTEDIYKNKTKTHQRALAEKGIDWQDFLDDIDEYDEAEHEIRMKALRRKIKEQKMIKKLEKESE